jgi:LysM repeat protein
MTSPGALFSRWAKEGKGKPYDPYTGRNVQKRNGANAFFAKHGDTYDQIAAEFSIKPEKIYKYNDVEPGQKPEESSIVYLQRKKKSAPRGNNVHTMKEGESLWSVAQWYGIRLKALYRKNRMKRGEVVVPGQEISLRYKIARQ